MKGPRPTPRNRTMQFRTSQLVVLAMVTSSIAMEQPILSAPGQSESSPQPPVASRPADAETPASQPSSLPAPEPPYTVPAAEPRPAEKVVEDFVRTVQSHATYPEAARKFVSEKAQAVTPDGAGDFLNSALAVCSTDYADALKAMEDERTADAAERFERLAGGAPNEPFLAVNAANMAATAMVELEQFPRAIAALEPAFAGHAPLDRYTIGADHMLFMLGYSYVRELRYNAAKAVLTRFLQTYPEAPQRLRVTATQIVTEIDRRVPGKLGDVRDLLAYAHHRIELGDTGEPVALRQEQAVALLDNMIEEAEENEKNARQKSPSGGGKGTKPQPSSGAKESRIPTGAPAGDTALRRARIAPGEAWGKMPPREREQIIQTLQRQFPSQYRDLLEQYYRQLAKDQPPS
ncbi:hypothetical protein RAS2_19240 [Phycisphaerae bacterium RAS2]|nr:hypothetical protein RAS2_19240 [Phycisphaerae bacterium RAS2]